MSDVIHALWSCEKLKKCQQAKVYSIKECINQINFDTQVLISVLRRFYWTIELRTLIKQYKRTERFGDDLQISLCAI